jgi:general secretion pathway protein L
MARTATRDAAAGRRGTDVNTDVRRVFAPLRVRYAAPLGRRFARFWSWWTGELYALLPQTAREAIARRQQRLFFETNGENLVVRQDRNGDICQILRDAPGSAPAGHADSGALQHDARETLLVLPKGKVLTKPITLPLAAEENLREVLAFEMDQYTPFKASEVYYDYVVAGRDSTRQTLSVDLVFSPRAATDALLDAVAAHGGTVDVVTARAPDGSNLLPVNLLPPERRRSRRGHRKINIALAALCLALLATAIALPIIQKNRAIRELEPRVQAAAATAREGSQLRQELEKMAETSRFLAEKKQSERLAVQVINEISRVLPDHTWISRLALTGTEFQLHGQSAASASLIEATESSPWFENARFRSPVVQIPGANADRFHLSATIIRSEKQ